MTARTLIVPLSWVYANGVFSTAMLLKWRMTTMDRLIAADLLAWCAWPACSSPSRANCSLKYTANWLTLQLHRQRWSSSTSIHCTTALPRQSRRRSLTEWQSAQPSVGHRRQHATRSLACYFFNPRLTWPASPRPDPPRIDLLSVPWQSDLISSDRISLRSIERPRLKSMRNASISGFRIQAFFVLIFFVKAFWPFV